MAQDQADEQFRLKAVTHSSSKGDMGQRMRLFTKLFISSEICTPGNNPKHAMEVWHTSPGHWNHIMNPANKIVGVGRNGLYWTADFAQTGPGIPVNCS
jgi:uncharacterized protein YkwD